jgi:hypothetical protein
LSIIKRLVLLLGLLSPLPALAFQADYGAYTGNATDNRTITLKALFTPTVVMIKCDATQFMVWRSSANTGDQAVDFAESNTPQPNWIQAFGAGTFEIGSSPYTNASGATCYYAAFGQTSENDLATGTYVGNAGTNPVVISPAFQPVLVLVKSLGPSLFRASQWKSSTQPTTSSYRFNLAASSPNSNIESLNANGFTVGNSDNSNATTITYAYVAFKATPNLAVNTFTGTAGAVTQSAGFAPSLVWIKGASATAAACARHGYQAGDSSFSMLNLASTTNQLTALTAGGFTTGTGACANENTIAMQWAAFGQSRRQRPLSMRIP